MNYHHFTIEERCPLREYDVKGKSYREKCKITRRERRLRLARIAEKLHVLQSYSEGLSAYRASKSNLKNGYRHRRMFCNACGEEKGILYCDQDTGQNCAWQKGMNENMNEWLREFYPKGRNLSRVSPATLKKNPA